MVRLLVILLLSAPLVGQQLHDEPAPSLEVPQVTELISIALADESDGPDSGNWYEKLKWWKEAKWTYTEHVHTALENLEGLQKKYEQRKQELLPQIEQYSIALPVKRQQAAQEIDELIEDMVRRQDEIAKADPSKWDESASDRLEVQKKLLSELKEKFEQFNTLTQRLTQAFDEIVPRLLADAQAYDERALESYQAIENTLDDKKAEQLYNQVENSLENIKAIINYLTNNLNSFIENAWRKLQQLMPHITESIQNLEEQGVKVRPLTQEEKEQMTAIEEQNVALRKQQAAEELAAKKKALRPWYEKFFDSVSEFFANLWSWIVAPFNWLMGLFTGEPAK